MQESQTTDEQLLRDHIALLVAKLMALTNTQTAAVCLLLAAAPVGYQWHAASTLRQAATDTARELAATTNARARAEAEAAATTRRFDARLTEAIGATRAQFLRSPLESRLEDLTTPIGDRDCIVGYHAERAADGTVQHYLRFEATDGSSMHQYVVDFMRWGQPTSDGVSHSTAEEPYRTSVGSPLWHYRHLFGDQPLLPLP